MEHSQGAVLIRREKNWAALNAHTSSPLPTLPLDYLGGARTDLTSPRCQWEAEPSGVCGTVCATSPGVTSQEVSRSGGLCVVSHCVINANTDKQLTSFTNGTLAPIQICSLEKE